MTRERKQSRQQEAYMHDYDGALTGQIIAGRTADVHGAFFQPYLEVGMSILDCGCGPGSITLGLAETVSPGPVTGIDLEESQVQLARKSAAETDLINVTFERNDVYDLPYDDNGFDAVFSHAMVEHLHDPLAVLKEMHRVLRPGGVIGIRSVDLDATLIAPDDPVLTNAHDIWLKYRRHCGGDPFLGRRLRALLREAGFARTVGSASSETWGTPQLAKSMMAVMREEFTGPKISETAIEMGWADQAQMDKAARAIDDWGGDEDAFMAIMWCEGIGWKGK